MKFSLALVIFYRYVSNWLVDRVKTSSLWFSVVELFRHQNTDTSLGWLKSMESSTDMPNVMVGVGCGFGCLTSGEGFLSGLPNWCSCIGQLIKYRNRSGHR